jgi:Cu/Ag efflux protein CusF
MSRNAFARFILAASLAGSFTACGMMADPDIDQPKVSGVYGESQVTKTATVQKIDLEKRLVTLKGESGEPFTIKAGPEVKNLPQLKVGDTVSATYYESIAYEVFKPGAADVAVGTKQAEAVAAAKEGQKPGAIAANVVQVTATIVAIDKETPSVTLKRPDGEVVAIKVRDRAKLDKVAVGDLAEITYTEAIAVTVEPTTK